MRASLKWLQRYADLPSDPQDISHRLTMAGYVVASHEAVTTPDGGDVAFDVEVTFNRPDLLSHVGIARELAGIHGVPLRAPDTAIPPSAAISDAVPVQVVAEDLCPVYTARVVRGVRVGPSPAWLVSALEAAGQRSVNNVVDVTNFVMLELGQPLHAFDLAKVAGPGIVVRRARGEPFTAIDGRRLDVGADDLAICDVAAPVALAGVMGGRDSEVSDATTDVLLESAIFAPLAIRATSRRHQLRSESSFRFERHVDPAGVHTASDRAAHLLVQVCGATGVGPIVSAGRGSAPHAARIVLRAQRVAHVLGAAVGESEVAQILTSLGLVRAEGVHVEGTSAWTAPSWRPDLVAEIDLIEEIGRRVGFDRIPERVVLPVRPRTPDRAVDVRRRVREALVRQGMRECISAPFVGAGPLDLDLLVAKPPLHVLNPMRSDENRIRRSLVGSLLATARRNRDRGVASVRLFEISPVYVAGATEGASEGRLLVAGLLSGAYRDAKGAVEAVLASLGVEAGWERGAGKPMRADRSATVRLAADGPAGVLGQLGELSVRAVQAYGLGGPTAVFELDVDALERAARFERPYLPISRFPAVERDLAWVVADGVTWSVIERATREAGAPLVRNVEFLSEFRSAEVGAGRKSVAFRMELRADDRTLTGDEADACVRAIVERLAGDTGGALRA